MCVIIRMSPGQVFPEKKLNNAIFNNPHGYGVVMLDNGRMEIKKDCPDGGNDPEVINKILYDNRDLERILHLRWNTVGETSIENTQPFDVLSSKDEDIVFMHNGTLYDYKEDTPSRWQNGIEIQSEKKVQTKSDTLRFTEEFLTPLMSRFKSPEGLEDPILKVILDKAWGAKATNRGILFSSKKKFIKLGDWKIFTDTLNKDDTTNRFLVSNEDYFHIVKRGPEFDRLEALKKIEESKNGVVPFRNSGGNKLSDWMGVRDELNKDFVKDLDQIWNEADSSLKELIPAMDWLTDEEIKKITKDDNFVYLFMWFTSSYSSIIKSRNSLRVKHQKATLLIEKQKKQMEAMNKLTKPKIKVPVGVKKPKRKSA